METQNRFSDFERLALKDVPRFPWDVVRSLLFVTALLTVGYFLDPWLLSQAAWHACLACAQVIAFGVAAGGSYWGGAWQHVYIVDSGEVCYVLKVPATQGPLLKLEMGDEAIQTNIWTGKWKYLKRPGASRYLIYRRIAIGRNKRTGAPELLQYREIGSDPVVRDLSEVIL